MSSRERDAFSRPRQELDGALAAWHSLTLGRRTGERLSAWDHFRAMARKHHVDADAIMEAYNRNRGSVWTELDRQMEIPLLRRMAERASRSC